MVDASPHEDLWEQMQDCLGPLGLPRDGAFDDLWEQMQEKTNAFDDLWKTCAAPAPRKHIHKRPVASAAEAALEAEAAPQAEAAPAPEAADGRPHAAARAAARAADRWRGAKGAGCATFLHSRPMLRPYKTPKTERIQAKGRAGDSDVVAPCGVSGSVFGGPHELQPQPSSAAPHGRFILELVRGARANVMKGLEDDVLRHCATGEDAAHIMNNLARRVGRTFPDHSGGFQLSGAGDDLPCRCRSSFAALQDFRASPLVSRSPEVLVAFDKALLAGGVASRIEAQRRGVGISKVAWARATALHIYIYIYIYMYTRAYVYLYRYKAAYTYKCTHM